MRWIHDAVPAPQEDLEHEYKASQTLGKVRLGDTWLFFSKFSGTSYLPYAQIVHAWLRQEEVNARLCCGRANFDQFYLMVEDAAGSVRRAELTSIAQGKEILSRIAAENPAAEIGYRKPVTA